jgi:hypothetical protein
MKKLLFLLTVCTAVCSTGCSEDPPAIRQIYVQLNIFDDRDKGAVYESLSLWIHPQDEDGIEDIEYLYLIHDDQELVWVLESETWDMKQQPGETWIGSNDVLMPDLSPLPRGEYRVIVVDAAGERDERRAYISQNTGLVQRVKLPEIALEHASIDVEGLNGRTFHLWVYDQNGSFKNSVTPSAVPLRFEEFLTRRGDGGYADHFFVYLYDHDEGCGIKGGPFYP